MKVCVFGEEGSGKTQLCIALNNYSNGDYKIVEKTNPTFAPEIHKLYMGPFLKNVVLIDTSGKKNLSSMFVLHARASNAILYVTKAKNEKISADDIYRIKDELEKNYDVPVIPVITCTDEVCPATEKAREKLLNFMHVSIHEKKTIENLYKMLMKMEKMHEMKEKAKENEKSIEIIENKNKCF